MGPEPITVAVGTASSLTVSVNVCGGSNTVRVSVVAYRTSNQTKLYISQSNDGKRLYGTLNYLRDGIWAHHGQQTALLEIELSLLEFAVSITRSVHAIEVSVVRDRISRSVS